MGPTLEEVGSLANLFLAARAARRHKRRFPYVQAFDADLEERLLGLSAQLRDGTYCPGEFTTFWVSDGKRRLISAAPYRDRVVHHAVVRVLEPLWERRFIHHCYACRKGKGAHAALDACTRFARRHAYVLHADVRKYFPSVDHAILEETLFGKVRDPGLRALLGRLIRHTGPLEPAPASFPGDDLFTPLERGHGIPIGNLTSQFFANVYLDAVDHEMTDLLGYGAYERFMDDMLVFGDTADALVRARAALESALERLRLKLHPGKRAISRTRDGVRFLGFRVFPSHRRMTCSGKRRQRRRLRALQREFRCGRLPVERLRASVASLRGHLLHADTYYLHARHGRGNSPSSGAMRRLEHGRGTPPPLCRGANRNDNEPINVNTNNGFRVAARSTRSA